MEKMQQTEHNFESLMNKFEACCHSIKILLEEKTSHPDKYGIEFMTLCNHLIQEYKNTITKISSNFNEIKGKSNVSAESLIHYEDVLESVKNNSEKIYEFKTNFFTPKKVSDEEQIKYLIRDIDNILDTVISEEHLDFKNDYLLSYTKDRLMDFKSVINHLK